MSIAGEVDAMSASASRLGPGRASLLGCVDEGAILRQCYEAKGARGYRRIEATRREDNVSFTSDYLWRVYGFLCNGSKSERCRLPFGALVVLGALLFGAIQPLIRQCMGGV